MTKTSKRSTQQSPRQPTASPKPPASPDLTVGYGDVKWLPETDLNTIYEKSRLPGVTAKKRPSYRLHVESFRAWMATPLPRISIGAAALGIVGFVLLAGMGLWLYDDAPSEKKALVAAPTPELGEHPQAFTPKASQTPDHERRATARQLVVEGRESYAAGDFKGARSKFERATRADPNYAPAYGHLSWAYSKLGKPWLAKKTYEKYQRVRRARLSASASLSTAS